QRHQPLGDVEQRLGVDGRLAVGLEGGVLAVERLAHTGDAAPHQLLGDRPVRVGEGGEDVVAVGPPRPQALGAGPGLGRRPGGPDPGLTGLAAVAALAPRPAFGAIATGPITVPVTTGPVGSSRPVTPVAAI